MIRNIIKNIVRLNLKTVFFNLKYLPIKQAIKLPIHLSSNVNLFRAQGKIEIKSDIIYSGMIQIGFGEVAIFDKRYSRSIWNVSGKVIFRGHAFIGQGSKITVGKDGVLDIGNNFNISAESTIVAFRNICFGDNCLLSWDILLMDTDFHYIKNKFGKVINDPKTIIVGNNVWIGCRTLILKGSKIPNNSIIGAYSLISNSLIEQECVYGGNPIKILKREITWTKDV